MIKICHIRGDKEYWNNFKLYKFWDNQPSLCLYENVCSLWNEHLKINYLDFRLHIRRLVLEHIVNCNDFDFIFYNDEEFKTFLKDNNDSIADISGSKKLGAITFQKVHGKLKPDIGNGLPDFSFHNFRELGNKYLAIT